MVFNDRFLDKTLDRDQKIVEILNFLSKKGMLIILIIFVVVYGIFAFVFLQKEAN